MPIVLLGHDDGKVTTVHVPDVDSWTDDERIRAITADSGNERGVWAAHKEHSNTDRPAWVESNDPEFADKLAQRFGCPVGRPAASEGTENK